MTGYTIPSYSDGHWPAVFPAFSDIGCDKTGSNIVSQLEKRAESSTVCGFHI